MGIGTAQQVTLRNLGVLAAIAGVSASAMAARDVLLQPADGAYTVDATVGSTKTITYRVMAGSSVSAGLASFVEMFASRQTAFAPEIAEIIHNGWDELFD